MRYQVYKKGRIHTTKIGKGFAGGTIFPQPKKKVTLRGIMGDSDGDGFYDLVDCDPNDPNKQGAIGDWVNKQKGRFQEWREKAPEREEARYEKRKVRLERQKELEQRRQEIQQTRQRTQESRLAVQKQRLGIQQQRESMQERRMKNMPSMMGGTQPTQPTMTLGDVWNISPSTSLGGYVAKKKPTKKRKKRRSKKKK